MACVNFNADQNLKQILNFVYFFFFVELGHTNNFLRALVNSTSYKWQQSVVFRMQQDYLITSKKSSY
jgi:hypothetical protein